MGQMTAFITEYSIFLWIAAAVILAVVEALSMGLTTIWFAIGAFAAAIVSLLSGNFAIEVVVFFVVSIVTLVFTRPIAIKKLNIGKKEKNITEKMQGQIGLVIESILPFNTGLVKLNGQEWTAIGETPEASIEKDCEVSIVRVEGVKLIVKPAVEVQS